MQKEEIVEDSFQKQMLSAYEALTSEGGILSHWRMRAFDHFLELGLPSRKDFPALRKILALKTVLPKKKELTLEEIAPYIYPECKSSFLVLVDGYFDERLSDTTDIPEKVVLMNLASAMQSYGVFLQNRLAKSLKEETDPFTALNAALQGSGIFLYLPPDIQVTIPIQILNITTKNEKSSLLSPRTEIYVGRRSEIACYVKNITLGNAASFCNHVIAMQLEEKAKLSWFEEAHFSGSSHHFSTTRAVLKKQAEFRSFTSTNGSHLFRQNTRVQMLEENAFCDLSGLGFLREDREALTEIFVEHAEREAKSHQLFKNVLMDDAKSSFSGKIFVRPIAQKTEAYQMSRSLLLSEKATALSKPNLEIFADDVKASHGATVSMLQEEELFYLLSRGLPRKEAEKILSLGFFQEALEKIPSSTFRENIEMQVKEFLHAR